MIFDSFDTDVDGKAISSATLHAPHFFPGPGRPMHTWMEPDGDSDTGAGMAWPGLIQPPLPSLPSPLLHMSGKLSMAELQSYFEYSESRLGSQAPLSERYAALSAAVSSKPDGSQMADFEEFVDLVRAQVAASEGAKGWVVSQVGASGTPRRWGRTTHL